MTIYKSFARTHLDYGDIIYDQTFNESFHQRIESMQYNAVIAITGAIRVTSSLKLYQELGLESLRSRRWLSQIDNISNIKTRSNFFRNSFFPSTITASITSTIEFIVSTKKFSNSPV